MSNNPYATPKAELQLSSVQLSRQGAWVPEFLTDKSRHMIWRRWCATPIDFGVCLFLLLLVLDIIVFVFDRDTAESIGILWFITGPIIYFSLMEGLTGYSVGKFIFRIRVVNEYGQVPGIPKAIVRTLFRLFEVNPFLLGGIPAGIVALCSKRSQRVGDMVANTYVIANKHLKES